MLGARAVLPVRLRLADVAVVVVVLVLVAVGLDGRLQPVLGLPDLLPQAPARLLQGEVVLVAAELLLLLLGYVGFVLLAGYLGVAQVRELDLVGLHHDVVAGRGRGGVPGEGVAAVPSHVPGFTRGSRRSPASDPGPYGAQVVHVLLLWAAAGAQDVADGAHAQVQHLPHVEPQAEDRHPVHDTQEDGLLCGPRHEAVDAVRAGLSRAHEHRRHGKTVQGVLARQEAHLQQRAGQQLQHVDAHQPVLPDSLPAVVSGLGLPLGRGLAAALHLGHLVDHGVLLLVVLRLLDPPVLPPAAEEHLPRLPVGQAAAPPGLPLLLPGNLVDGITEVHERGRGHQDDLEDPEANVREGRKGVVADILTTRLARVADEFALLIVVDGLATNDSENDAEDN